MDYRRGKIADLKKVMSGLQSEYESKHLTLHKEVATYTYPNGGYFDDEHDPSTHGDKRTDEIYDSIASIATRVATSGIASGLTPQTSRWGAWKPEDKDLMELTGVREWADEVTEKDFHIMSRSNFYKEQLKFYAEAFVFGTACIITDFHPTRWIHCKTLTIGEYYFLEDEWGVPDILYRKLWMQAHEMERKFGLENLSNKVQNAIKQNNTFQWFEVCNVIQPVIGWGGFTYESIYFEKTSEKPNEILMETGYFSKPFTIFRWQQIGSEKWGRSPVIEALPDIRTLHTICADKLDALEYMIKGLWAVIDGSVKDFIMRGDPGDINVLKPVPGFNGQPLTNISTARDFPYAVVYQEIETIRSRINSILFGDLFQALNALDPKRTAFEVSAIQDQNQRVLAPVIGNFISDAILPQAERRFDILHRHGAFSEPPQEVIGEELSLEMTSSLSMIQQKVSTVAMEQLAGFVGSLVQQQPDIIDKIDYDQSVDEYSSAINAPGSMVRSDDQVEKIRTKRAEDQARQQQIIEQSQAAQNIKTLSEAKTGEESALTGIMGA